MSIAHALLCFAITTTTASLADTPTEEPVDPFAGLDKHISYTADIPTIVPDTVPVPLSLEGPDFAKSPPSALGSNRDFFRQIREQTVIVRTERGHGSGVIVDNDGLVLTNYHVVEPILAAAVLAGNPPTCDLITCEVTMGRPKRNPRSIPGTVIAADPVLDLALIRPSSAPRTSAGRIPPVKLAQTIEAGDRCLVVGSQGGGLAWSVRAGIVSGNYEFPADLTQAVAAASPDPRPITRMVAGIVVSDCPISPGDSGGPLFNEQGQLAAVTFATPGNLSGGATGYHIALPAIKRFLATNEGRAPLTPFDLWSLGEPNYIASLRTCLDFDRDGHVDVTQYIALRPSDSGLEPYGQINFFDTSDSLHEFDFENRKTQKGLSIMPNTAALLPRRFWGIPEGGTIKADRYVMMRNDGLVLSGPITSDGQILEMRIELSTATHPHTQLRWTNGAWQHKPFYGSRFPIDGLNATQMSTFLSQIKTLFPN